MKFITLLVLSAFYLFAGIAAGQSPSQELFANNAAPYEMDQVHRQCRDAPFMFVSIPAVKDGVTHELGVISCLSAKTDRLITLVCDRSNKTCQTSTSQDGNSLRLEKELRRIEAESKKGST